MEEFFQHGEIRGEVEVLPHIGLQQRGMIGETVENLSRRQPVILDQDSPEVRNTFSSLVMGCASLCWCCAVLVIPRMCVAHSRGIQLAALAALALAQRVAAIYIAPDGALARFP